MAKIKTDNKEIKIKDGEPITKACEELGVPFGCYTGTCGSCKIGIEEGADNLSELTDEENALGMDKNTRLACQCNIKGGEVRIKL